MAQTWYGNMGPFKPVRLKGGAQVNGVPTFVDKLPLTIGGWAGTDLKFGRVASLDPTGGRRTFVAGIPAGYIPKGLVMMDPTIMVADPAMNDYYFAGKPVTLTTMGLIDIYEYDTSKSSPAEGSTVWARNSDGVLAFNDGTDISADGYTKLNAFVYESLDPNGAKVWFGLPLVADATRETTTAAAEPTPSTAAGAVAAGTAIKLDSDTVGATIYYTTDGSTPDMSSQVYNGMAITISSAVTIKAIAVASGYDPSSVLEAAYTIA